MTESTSTTDPGTTSADRAVVVPDRAALEGLEEKWVERWRADDTYAFDRTQPAAEGLLDRHPAADRVGVAARRPRLLLHPHRPASRASSGCRASRCSTRWAGTTTACPTERRVQNYFGVRCDPSLPYDADFTPPEKPDPKQQVPISRPNFIELCERLVERGRAGLREPVAHPRPLGRLVAALHDHRRRRPQPVSQRAFLRNLARGEAYLQEAPDPVGRHLPDRGRPGRARGPRVRRRTTTGSPSTGADGEPVFIETTRPELIASVRRADRPPRRRALPAAVRHDGDLAGLRRRDPGARPPGGRAGQGRRHRDVLHVRRPHRRHLVARAAAADPHRSSAATAGSRARRPTWLAQRTGRGGVRGARRARRPSPPARRSWRSCARAATSTASRGRPSGWRTSTRRATSRSRSSPPGSGTSATAAATRDLRDGDASPAAREIDWIPAHMQHRYDNWVGGLNGDWLI